MGRFLITAVNQVWAIVSIPVVFCLVILPITLFSAFLPLKRRMRLIGPAWKIFSRFLLIRVCHASLYEEDHRQPEVLTNPLCGLYIANHQSYLDIPIIATQHQVLPIMKREVAFIPILGQLCVISGALVVKRGRRDSHKKVFIQARERLVDQKFGVMLYPEGTRSKDGAPREYKFIKAPLIHLAFEHGVPVIPTSIYGTSQVLTNHGIIRPGKKLGIITHAALWPKDYPDASTFSRAVWDKVLTGYEELRAKLQN